MSRKLLYRFCCGRLRGEKGREKGVAARRLAERGEGRVHGGRICIRQSNLGLLYLIGCPQGCHLPLHVQPSPRQSTFPYFRLLSFVGLLLLRYHFLSSPFSSSSSFFHPCPCTFFSFIFHTYPAASPPLFRRLLPFPRCPL